MTDKMKRPERLLYFNSKERRGRTKIEALFYHAEIPIHFNAILTEGDREFQASIYSSIWEIANEYDAMELLDACYCKGYMKPEHAELNKWMDDLIKECVIASDDNSEDCW